MSGNATLWSQESPAPPLPPPGQNLSPDQLDGLVAPIALYPDELVSQILVASTYPLELVQAWQWLQRNPGLTGPALTQDAEQQNRDPSIQALVVFPDLVKRLNQDITWTTNLGNAFLAQQPDVMNAIQQMRLRAQPAGKLAFTPQQKVLPAAANDTHTSREPRGQRCSSYYLFCELKGASEIVANLCIFRRLHAHNMQILKASSPVCTLVNCNMDSDGNSFS